MSASALLRAALTADPIAFSMAAVALALVAAAIPFRRGGVDARFIIQVFSILATIGTIPRIALWVGVQISNARSPFDLSGTDLVLAAGGLVAIVWSAIQELFSIFVGDRKEPSLVDRWWQTTEASKLLSKLFRRQTEQVEETPEAKAARERREAGEPHDDSHGN